MSYAEIPLTCASDAYQNFKITLGSGDEKKNVQLELRLRYLDRYDLWLADVTELSRNEVLAAGIPMVLGTDLMGQMGYKGAGEVFIVQTLPSSLEHPDNKTLGKTFRLIWGDSYE